VKTHPVGIVSDRTGHLLWTFLDHLREATARRLKLGGRAAHPTQKLTGKPWSKRRTCGLGTKIEQGPGNLIIFFDGWYFFVDFYKGW
jgi:hypothetical protein